MHKKTHKASHKKKHWGYAKNGKDWSAVTGNTICKTGKRQSPVNVRTRGLGVCKTSKLKGGQKFCNGRIKFNYKSTKATILNNGHTIQVTFQPGNSFSVCGETFPLAQLHFHHRSENQYNGRNAPMEMHMVHVQKGTKNPFAVIGVMLSTRYSKFAAKYRKWAAYYSRKARLVCRKRDMELVQVEHHRVRWGRRRRRVRRRLSRRQLKFCRFYTRKASAYSRYARFFDPLAGQASLFAKRASMGSKCKNTSGPCKKGKQWSFKGTINPAIFLPRNKSYYRFQGSFTTPPCTQGVRWFMMRQYGSISKKTLSNFYRAMEFQRGRKAPSQANHDNRSVQKTNGRYTCIGGVRVLKRHVRVRRARRVRRL